MDDGICPDCTMLHLAALEVRVHHFHAESRLAIAKLVYDRRTIRELEPVVEILFRARSAAVRAYQEHVDAHAQAAQSWWR
jgi:hypothetical protein